MNNYRPPRGRPIMMLLLVLGGWIGLRGAYGEIPMSHAAQGFAGAGAGTAGQPPLAGHRQQLQQVQQVQQVPAVVYVLAEPDPGLIEQIIMRMGFRPGAVWQQQAAPGAMRSSGMPGSAMWGSAMPGSAMGGSVQQGAMSSTGILPWSYSLAPGAPHTEANIAQATPQAAPFQPAVQAAQAKPLRRWSVDGWALLRQDTTTALASGRNSYGASQAGVVLRYRVMPKSGHRPEIYGRISQAMAGAQEVEGALGVSARPLADVPVTLAAEGRVSRVNGRTSIRPAAYAVTQLPPVQLPLGVRAEAYAQAGYVWGDYSSAFVDGQVRAERPVVRIGTMDVHAGAGVWGGAQKGAGRLDVGPAASVYMPLGKLNSRVSVDWRMRVAGQAEPSDGAAITVSTGF